VQIFQAKVVLEVNLFGCRAWGRIDVINEPKQRVQYQLLTRSISWK
jgi:hypothetical protein